MYAPTTERAKKHQNEIKKLYKDLDQLGNQLKKQATSATFIAGDFNAQVGKRTNNNERWLGVWSRGIRNDNGSKLIDFCEEKNLIVANSCFQHPAKHITTWSQQRTDTGAVNTIFNQIDYIICDQKHKHILTDARSYSGTETHSDHRLVVTRIEVNWAKMYLSNLGLSQVICEPTNFEPNKNSSCIDLVITDQPNLILDSGPRASLDPYCHHQIIYCKVNFRIPPSPPLDRKIWHFNRANSAAIKSSMTNFPWLQHLNLYTDANWQVKTFTDIFLNIMSNFIPNEIKRFVPRDPPWITKPIKTLLNRKNIYF